MPSNSVTRRDILKTLTAGVVAGSVLRVIPAQAAEYAHKMIQAEHAASGTYKPKYFSAPQYKTLQALCQTIIPADDHGGIRKMKGVLQPSTQEERMDARRPLMVVTEEEVGVLRLFDSKSAAGLAWVVELAHVAGFHLVEDGLHIDRIARGQLLFEFDRPGLLLKIVIGPLAFE